MSSPQIERKLAAIMFTDIAGYTALSAKDSKKTSELLKTQRNTLKPIVEKHGGSWMKEIGDGLLLTFDSATSAVECSIAIQEATKDIEDLNLRIGIHQGEVIKQDGDVIGDDVNVTSRIEPFSAVGGVAISDKVYRDISSNQEFDTKYIGKPKLKGVSQKVEVYCITSHGLPETDISKVSAKLEEESKFNIFTLTGGILTAIGIAFWIAVGVFDVSFGKTEVPSVGILLMDNLGNEDDEFWASGMTADLITKVAGAGIIRVAPLDDILKLDKKLSIEEKAKKLRVKYILTHSFLVKDNGFDLWCKLENVENGIALFSNKISEPMDMATQMVGKLANDIITSLEVETKQNMMKVPTTNVEAYEYYQRAKYIFNKRNNNEDIEISKSLITKAIAIDNDLLEAKLLYGGILDYLGEYEIAISIFKETLKKAQQSNDSKNIRESISNLVSVYLVHDLSGFIDLKLLLHKQLNNSRKNGNKLQERLDLLQLSKFQGDKDSIKYYCNLAIDVSKKYLEKNNLMHDYAILGSKYYFDYKNSEINSVPSDALELKNAKIYYMKALETSKEIDDKYWMMDWISFLIDIDFELALYDEMLYKIQELYELAKSENDIYIQGSVMMDYVRYYLEINNIEIAKKYYQKYYDLISMENSIVYDYRDNNASKFYLELGDYEKAESHIIKHMHRMLEKNDYSQAYRGLIWFYRDLGMIEKAIKYSDKAVKKCTEVNDNLQLSYFISEKFDIYNKIGLIDSAKFYIDKSYTISKRKKMWVAEKQHRINLIDHYINNKNYKKSKEIILESLDLSLSKSDSLYYFLFNVRKGKLFFELGDFSNASEIFDSYREFSMQKNRREKIQLHVLITWIKTELKLNNYKKAEKYFEELTLNYTEHFEVTSSLSLQYIWEIYDLSKTFEKSDISDKILNLGNNKIELYKNNMQNEKYKNLFLNLDFTKAIIEEWEKDH